MARRDTRELILATSLRLFNRLGEPNVPTNLIADEADISPGNLHYHFRRKEQIVQALFERFASDLLPLISLDADSPRDAETIWFRMHILFELKGDYRFLYRNLADISKRMPRIEKALHGLMLRERSAVERLFELLIEGRVLDVNEAQRDMLADQLMLTFTYWIPFADLFDPKGYERGDAQLRAIADAFLLVYPYLKEPWRSQVRSMAEFYLSKINR